MSIAPTQRDVVLQAVARGWCHEANSAKEMDSDLAEAITAEVCAALAEQAEPVAWQWLDTSTFRKRLPSNAEPGAWRPLYAANCIK